MINMTLRRTSRDVYDLSVPETVHSPGEKLADGFQGTCVYGFVSRDHSGDRKKKGLDLGTALEG